MIARSGWQYDRVGPYIVASEPGKAVLVPSYLEVIQAAGLNPLKNIILQRPQRPVLIGAIPGEKLGLDQQINLTGLSRDNSIQILSSLDELEYKALSGGNQAVLKDDLQVSIESGILRNIPSDIHASWNRFISQKINFVNSKPDFMAHFRTAKKIEIKDSSAGFSLAYSGPDAELFLQEAEVWIQNEERHNRPSRQGFKTPDGTLGYEIVPGDPEPVVESWSDNCQAPISGRSTLWLCRQGDKAVLGTSMEVARQALASESLASDVYLVGLSQTALAIFKEGNACEQNEPSILLRTLCLSSRVYIQGSEEAAIMEIDF